jgi:hypothetical protein
LSTQNALSSENILHYEGKVKTVPDEGKRGEFVTSMPSLKYSWKEFSKQKGNDKRCSLGTLWGKEITWCWALVTHSCHPSYSGGRDQEDHSSKLAWANSSHDPILKKNPSQ